MRLNQNTSAGRGTFEQKIQAGSVAFMSRLYGLWRSKLNSRGFTGVQTYDRN